MNKSLIYAICIYLFAIKALAADPTFTRLEPEWVKYNVVRNANNYDSILLNDLQSHLPAGHPYGTSGHECTHGIHSYIRLKYAGQGRINALYFLNDRAVILIEPNTTLSNVAKQVPVSLRGDIYNLYLIQSQSYWNNSPLYLFDEFAAYINGSLVGLDLAKNGNWHGGKRSDTVQYMLESSVYCLVLTSVVVNISNVQKEYDDTSNFKALMRWQLRRAMQIYKESKNYNNFSSPIHEQYLRKLRTNPDAENLRTFARNYFGDNWTKSFLEF